MEEFTVELENLLEKFPNIQLEDIIETYEILRKDGYNDRTTTEGQTNNN